MSISLLLSKINQEHIKNYRHASILHVVSKIFQKFVYNHLSTHFENFFSKCQCGLWKGFNIQDCLLLRIENWKHAVNNSKVFGALLTDLSKTFDCVCHYLLIPKLNTYGLSLSALKPVHNYEWYQNNIAYKQNDIAYSLWE